MLALFQYIIQTVLVLHCKQNTQFCTNHSYKSTDYSGMFSWYLLFQKLFRHNRPVPTNMFGDSNSQQVFINITTRLYKLVTIYCTFRLCLLYMHVTVTDTHITDTHGSQIPQFLIGCGINSEILHRMIKDQQYSLEISGTNLIPQFYYKLHHFF